ncbi:MAG: septum formation initiator family protein [Pseudomonadota bacterium]
MSSSSSIFRRFRQAVAPVIAFTIMVYFIFHSIEGNRGVLAYWSMQDRVSEISHVLDDVVLLRQDRERRVRALRSSSLDPDLLDERARIMLNTAHRDDLIIFHHNGYDQP